MTLNEAKAMLEAKLSEAKALIEASKNGEKLHIATSITYMDAKLDESSVFTEGKSTSILANLIIRAAGKIYEEDHEFYYTIATNVNNSMISDVKSLEKEYLDFDSRVLELIDKLAKTDDAEALVAEECRLIEEEGRQMVAKFEASLKNLKKGGIIAACAVFGLLILLFVIKAIFSK